MHALEILAIYLLPFAALGFLASRWLRRKAVGLGDVRAEGDPARPRRPRFLLGIWRDDARQ